MAIALKFTTGCWTGRWLNYGQAVASSLRTPIVHWQTEVQVHVQTLSSIFCSFSLSCLVPNVSHCIYLILSFTYSCIFPLYFTYFPYMYTKTLLEHCAQQTLIPRIYPSKTIGTALTSRNPLLPTAWHLIPLEYLQNPLKSPGTSLQVCLHYNVSLLLLLLLLFLQLKFYLFLSVILLASCVAWTHVLPR